MQEDQDDYWDLNLDSPSSKSPKKQSSSRKARAREVLVDSDVRRSTRLKIRNKGFKQTSCGKANCLGCTSKPPIIPTSVIRNLGSELAQIDPELLSEDNLMKKKAVGAVGTKKKAASTLKHKKNDNTKSKKNEDNKDEADN